MRMSETVKPRLDELLKAAGEPTRLRILNLLRRGSICVCEIQAVLRLTQSTVSRHLAALRHAGLVTDVREGPRVIYSLASPDSPQVAALLALLEVCCPLEPELDEENAGCDLLARLDRPPATS